MSEDTSGGRERGTAPRGSGGDDPVDWQAERRWNDRPWVQVTLILAIAVGAVVVVNLSLYAVWGHANPGGVAGGIGGLTVALWRSRRVRRQVAEESGLSPWQVMVVGRWLRKGRVPADPKARRAMTALVREQQRALQQNRWAMPVMMTLFAVGGAVLLVVGNFALGGLLVVVVVLLVPALVRQRRDMKQLPRIEKQLAASRDAASLRPAADA
ncbi:hypothetical protein [Streptomyces sp. NPDC059398]|uniref:hypothetical protein n=1 Tax=Streptomyces sp. NPDC059398 TaxID=3346820 RepID=UPI00369A1FD8